MGSCQIDPNPNPKSGIGITLAAVTIPISRIPEISYYPNFVINFLPTEIYPVCITSNRIVLRYSVNSKIDSVPSKLRFRNLSARRFDEDKYCSNVEFW